MDSTLHTDSLDHMLSIVLCDAHTQGPCFPRASLPPGHLSPYEGDIATCY